MTSSSEGQTPEMQTGGHELETFERVLEKQDSSNLDFKARVEHALADFGGRLLFHMCMDGMSGCDEVAAIAIDTEKRRIFALAILPTNGGTLRVEESEASDIPVARIAAAYSGLMDRLAA